MYDFHFGSKEEIRDRDEDFLIFIKRLLPRWVNGIPDSECLAIYRILKNLDTKNPILVETGCGASTIAMFLYCALYEGKMYSWDTNGSKGSFLRTVISESIGRPLDVNTYDIWTFIAFDSTSEFVGLPILDELNEKADFGFFDSWHTLDHLLSEINCFETIAKNEFVVLLDDAHYRNKSNNFSYVNMMRNKLNLPPIEEPSSNLCKPFHKEIDKYLTKKYKIVKRIEDTYKKEFKQDIFFDYFSSERKSMEKHGMVEMTQHRLEGFKVNK
tara:strand:- start:499 stop:1308 length:810 start_codon:yes stop_codon:yes gene_type:complete